jgi:peroxiredoxin
MPRQWSTRRRLIFLFLRWMARPFPLADYRGKKKVIVSYWASWCGPCRMELPMLASFYKKYHQDSSDFEILAVSIDDDRAAAQSFANTAKLPFPVLLDLDSKAADSYSVEAIPSLFVIGLDSTIVYFWPCSRSSSSRVSTRRTVTGNISASLSGSFCRLRPCSPRSVFSRLRTPA